MTDDLSALNLEDDYQEVLRADCAARWKLEKPAALEMWATIYPARAPTELFQARLLWRVYPGEPPSVKFRDPATGRLELTSAWPQVRGFRPTSFDTCVNWSAESHVLAARRGSDRAGPSLGRGTSQRVARPDTPATGAALGRARLAPARDISSPTSPAPQAFQASTERHSPP